MVSDIPPEFRPWFTRFASESEKLKIDPHEWQVSLAADASPRSRVIRIPTGYGKTLGALGAWLYHRVVRGDERWPRRLVWVLPMRVLVEQTFDEVRRCLSRLDLLWQPGTDRRGKVGVHALMGGVDPGGEWNLFPEECAVFIATQDMALSRALNRGFAAPRARWPMEFGLLSQDALWVLDEVQLMDVGLATSAQLQAFFDEDADSGRSLRPRVTWWMSATLQPSWLLTTDTARYHPRWVEQPTTLPAASLRSGLATVCKPVEVAAIPAADHVAFADTIHRAHLASPAADAHGRITLVVCNTVERASRTFDALSRLSAGVDLRLVHSRFRPHERAAWKQQFLGRDACTAGVDRIIVATQVVEAGVDISASTLVTELAPWSSVVQRAGRCARYGGAGRVIVVDRGDDDKAALPYASEALQASRWALDALGRQSGDIGVASLEAFERGLGDGERKRLYPFAPPRLLLRRDFDELFDTTPDLTGADVDVSAFIRSGDERDVSVFWVDVPDSKKGHPHPRPPTDRKPSRLELCSVPFLAARDWLCGKATKEKPATRLLASRRAWTWDWLDGEWKVAERAAIVPGAIVCVAADTGGYRVERGFDAESRSRVGVLDAPSLGAQDAADDLEDNEKLSAASYKTIATHNAEVGQYVVMLASKLVPERLCAVVALAGRWHDLGKSHPAFQAIIADRGPFGTRVDLAKAPDGAWQTPCRYRIPGGDTRRGFRHELASCLALFAVLRRYEPTHPALLGPWIDALTLLGEAPASTASATDPSELERQVLACSADEFDLLAYLVLAHHGKVRLALHAGPKDQDYVVRDAGGMPVRGVRDGDVLPPILLDGERALPGLTLSLAPAGLGLSPITGRSWRDRTASLQRDHGPGALAFLEALLIAADRRASKLVSRDPLLSGAPEGVQS